MARVHFVKSARKNIYAHGKVVSYLKKKGKNIGGRANKLDRTIPADDTDTILIAVGQSYYWWQPKNSNKRISRDRPTRSQLTQSSFLGSLYDLQDRIGSFSADTQDEFNEFKEEVMGEIESLKDECQNSLDNMPEHLQESSSSGQLLTERIDALDSWYSEIEGIECEYDEDSIREEKRTDSEKEEGELDDDYLERIDQETAEAILEIVRESVDQLQNTDCGL